MVKDFSKFAHISSSGATFFNFENEVDLDTSLIVGLSPTNYHTFLLCKDREYHPSLSMRQCRMLKRKNKVVRACIFLKISNLDKALVNKVYDLILKQANMRTGSCHMGVYDFLSETIGLNIDVQYSRLMYNPSLFIEGFANNKVQVELSKDAKIDICMVRNLTVEETITDIKKYEKKFFFGYLASYAALKIYKFFNIPGKYKVSTELRTLVNALPQ